MFKLDTERLQIRDLRSDDAAAMFAYRSAPEVMRFQTWEPKSLRDVESFIESGHDRKFGSPGWYQVANTLHVDGTLIGDCGVHILEDEPRVAEIAITIAPAFQCKGYAREALTALISLLFSDFNKHRVFASVDPQNLASMKLFERLGFRKEAHLVQSLWFKDGWADDVIFAVLADEWRARTTNSSD